MSNERRTPSVAGLDWAREDDPTLEQWYQQADEGIPVEQRIPLNENQLRQVLLNKFIAEQAGEPESPKSGAISMIDLDKAK